MFGNGKTSEIPNEPCTLIIGEGIYDVKAVERILKLKGFKPITSYEQLPPFERAMIPTKYPADSGELSYIVSHPSFLKKDGMGYVAVANAGGITKIPKRLYSLIEPHDTENVILWLRSVTVLADMDNENASKRKVEIQKQFSEFFREVGSDDMNVESFLQEHESGEDRFFQGHILFDGREIPSFLYLFPDCRNAGTLEKLLLAGAEKYYPKLQTAAKEYVSKARQIAEEKLEGFKRLQNFDGDKAEFGSMASVLKPGRANQASISDDKWFTKDSLQNVELHQRFSHFLEKVLNTLEKPQ